MLIPRFLIHVILGTILSGVYSVSCLASPWIPSSDLRLRHHLQAYSSQLCLEGSTLTWPITWNTVKRSLDAASEVCRQSEHYWWLSKAFNDFSNVGVSASVYIAAATDEELIRTATGSPPRGQGQASAGVGFIGNRVAANVNLGYLDSDLDDQSLILDGSYVAAVLGNWQFGVGSLDRWWGPGQRASIALSDSARPVPGLWVSRHTPFAPESRWLSWIGPWNLYVLVGQLENDRVVPDAKLVGARFTFRPLERFELGLTRLLLWGGEGRPEDFHTFWNAFSGNDNGVTGGDPSNQIAGFDFRISFGDTSLPIGLYGQFMGEDEAKLTPSKVGSQLGADVVTSWANGSQRFFVEGASTVVDKWFGQEPRYNIMYEHSVYRSGFRYRQRNLASVWESDADIFTFGIQHHAASGVVYTGNVSMGSLNGNGDEPYKVPNGDYIANEETDITLIEIGVSHEFIKGELNWSFQWMDTPVQTPEYEFDDLRASISWYRQFDF